MTMSDYLNLPGNEPANLHQDTFEWALQKTYDFARLMEGATEVKCSQFADELIKNMS